MNEEKRRQLKNDYKSKPDVGAVYAIECSGNHRRCIKFAMDVEGIKNRFNFAMLTKTCPDPAVKSDFDQYGLESLSLVILEELEKKKDQTAKEFRDDMKQLYELWLEKADDQERKDA